MTSGNFYKTDTIKPSNFILRKVLGIEKPNVRNVEY